MTEPSDLDEREFRERQFQKAVTEGLVPRIEGSALYVGIMPDMEDIDAKFCVELGVAIMLNKPILALKGPGVELSPKLLRVADEVFEIDDLSNPEERRRLAEVIKEFGERIQEQEEEA